MYLGLHYDVPRRDPVSLTVTSASIKFRCEIPYKTGTKQGRQFPCEGDRYSAWNGCLCVEVECKWANIPTRGEKLRS